MIIAKSKNRLTAETQSTQRDLIREFCVLCVSLKMDGMVRSKPQAQTVIPAKAGIQAAGGEEIWIPAFAGMTKRFSAASVPLW